MLRDKIQRPVRDFRRGHCENSFDVALVELLKALIEVPARGTEAVADDGAGGQNPCCWKTLGQEQEFIGQGGLVARNPQRGWIEGS